MDAANKKNSATPHNKSKTEQIWLHRCVAEKREEKKRTKSILCSPQIPLRSNLMRLTPRLRRSFAPLALSHCRSNSASVWMSETDKHCSHTQWADSHNRQVSKRSQKNIFNSNISNIFPFSDTSPNPNEIHWMPQCPEQNLHKNTRSFYHNSEKKIIQKLRAKTKHVCSHQWYNSTLCGNI